MEQYLIPKNVKTRFEFFPGFGFKEVFITLAGLLIGGIIYLFITIFTQHPAALLSIVACGGLAFAISKPEPRTGLSLLQTLKNFKEFKLKPSRYYYRFGEGRKNG